MGVGETPSRNNTKISMASKWSVSIWKTPQGHCAKFSCWLHAHLPSQQYSGPVWVSYIPWANFNSCDSWACNEAYLNTAVQCGAKLRARRTQTLKKRGLGWFRGVPKALPEGVEPGKRNCANPTSTICIHTYIHLPNRDNCRAHRFRRGIWFLLQTRHLCSKRWSTQIVWCWDQAVRNPKYPFVYYKPCTATELITTGLLLGYPFESTCSILCGY